MALDFDGVDDKVAHGDIAAMDGASALTIVAWLNPDNLEAGSGFFGKSVDTSNCWGLCSGPSASAELLHDMTSTFGRRGVTAATPLVTGTWVHVGWWFDGSQSGDARARIYINGSSSGLTYSGGGSYPATIFDLAISFDTGHNLNGSGTAPNFQDAKIAHLRAWTAALTTAEIIQEMNSYRPVRTANLILWSPYDDATSAKDYSGSGNHGTVTGALQVAGPPVSYGGD